MRYHQKYCVVDKDKAVRVKDRRGQVKMRNTTVFITTDEYAEIRPGEPKRRLDFVFRFGSPLLMDPDIATFLVKKYDFLFVIGTEGEQEEMKDELNYLGWHSLVQMLKRYNDAAEKLGIPRASPVGKAEQLRERIRQFIKLGVKPAKIKDEDEDDE